MERAASDYLLCGWRVRSELPLPELWPWTGDDRPVDVWIVLGMAPPALADPVQVTPFLQIAADGTCRLEVKSVACFLIEGGSRVTVEPVVARDSPELRAFLLGSVLGLLAHQRGLFPLHAACVHLEYGAVALAGPSGSGKSTLAAVLVGRGHALLSDDVCVIDPAAAGGPVVLPAFPRLKLWADALAVLGQPTEGLERNRLGMEKYHLRHQLFTPTPVKLRRIYVLEIRAPVAEMEWERVQGFAALSLLAGEVYRRRPSLAMGREAALFAGAASVAAAVAVIRLARKRDHALLERTASHIEAGAVP